MLRNVHIGNCQTRLFNLRLFLKENCIEIMTVYLRFQVLIAINTAKPAISLRTTRFTIPKFHILSTHFIYDFSMDLRTNSDYFPIQH